MVALATLALGIALASALRLSRSAGRDLPRESTGAYLGGMKDDAVLAAAKDSDEQCDAYDYLGRLHAPEDASVARRQLLRAANEDCDQAELAREELQALQSR